MELRFNINIPMQVNEGGQGRCEIAREGHTQPDGECSKIYPPSAIDQ